MSRRRPWTEARLKNLRDRLESGHSYQDIAADEGVTPELIGWAIKKYTHNNTPPAQESHGMTGTRTYAAWGAMIQRVTNPNDSAYSAYGGRGISICDRWLEFRNFLADMGVRPSKNHSVDRIDNSGDYEPNNCRWATHYEQQRNKRSNNKVLWQGQEWILSDLCTHLGIYSTHLYRNLKRGMSKNEAIQHLVNLKEKRSAKVNPPEASVYGRIPKTTE